MATKVTVRGNLDQALRKFKQKVGVTPNQYYIQAKIHAAKQALKENDIDYILKEGIAQEEKGAHILDVNVGLPEIDEVQMLRRVVCELQAISPLPLQIDTSDALAMEAALRRYNGKAMITARTSEIITIIFLHFDISFTSVNFGNFGFYKHRIIHVINNKTGFCTNGLFKISDFGVVNFNCPCFSARAVICRNFCRIFHSFFRRLSAVKRENYV